MKKKKQKYKKQKKLKTPHKCTTSIMVLLCLMASSGLLWIVLNAQIEHRNQHYAEDVPNQQKLKLEDLEEAVRKDPNNFNAWKLLGLKYRQNKDYAKAKESWNRALEKAHS